MAAANGRSEFDDLAPMKRPIIEPDVGVVTNESDARSRSWSLVGRGWLRVNAVAARRGE
jgi:hypothetical protein